MFLVVVAVVELENCNHQVRKTNLSFHIHTCNHLVVTKAYLKIMTVIDLTATGGNMKQTSHQQQRHSVDTIETTYPVKSVTFNTCSDLYLQWSSRKRMYAKAALGLAVRIEYADTIDQCTNVDQPLTILALHGAPGSHHDFKPFIEYFGSKNIRIIVPNYPGMFLIYIYIYLTA